MRDDRRGERGCWAIIWVTVELIRGRGAEEVKEVNVVDYTRSFVRVTELNSVIICMCVYCISWIVTCDWLCKAG